MTFHCVDLLSHFVLIRQILNHNFIVFANEIILKVKVLQEENHVAVKCNKLNFKNLTWRIFKAHGKEGSEWFKIKRI